MTEAIKIRQTAEEATSKVPAGQQASTVSARYGTERKDRKPMVSWAVLLDEAVKKPGFIHEAYSRFHSYSIGNQLLALFQCFERGIQPGPLATFPRWKELGRHVKKGEKALTLCMPLTCKRAKAVNRVTRRKRVRARTFHGGRTHARDPPGDRERLRTAP
jgi:hypothetical protein